MNVVAMAVAFLGIVSAFAPVNLWAECDLFLDLSP